MFSNYLNSATAVVIAMAFCASVSFGQQPQTPSSRFQPDKNVPPSVHIPTKNARNLKLPAGHDQFQQRGARPGLQSPGFSLSDGNRNVRETGYGDANRRQRSTELRRPSNRLPEIPKILRGQPSSNPPPTQLQNFGKSGSNIDHLRPPSQAPSGRSGQPVVVNQQEFDNHKQDMQQKLDELKRLQQQVKAATSTPAPHNQVPTNQRTTAGDSPIQQVTYLQQPDAPNSFQGTIESEVKGQPSSIGQPLQADSNKFANRIGSVDTQSGSPFNSIRKTSGMSEINSGASLTLETPAIRVQTFGPDSIGINKIATYKVTISNDGHRETDKITVGVAIPDWVDLQNINLSTGHHEISSEEDKPRLIWTVDRVPANTTHTIAINAVPRAADPFDLKVEWSFAPRTGSTHVQVTEPKLDMSISGPTDVLFGEKATYDVTIANPGTGTAEQVSVKLPEALGGERQNIPDIPAGGEQKFNIELFARTAGLLDLTVSANGDGNIEANATHQIRVRRAKLNVTVDGPPIKYAGTMGRYKLTVVNEGDATASDVVAVMALPTGVKYLSGLNAADVSDGGLKWNVGTLTPGDRKSFEVNCQLDSSGDLVIQAGVRGTGDLAASAQVQTRVDTIADLTLAVEDPKGPLPTGENIVYKLIIKNRGTRSATGVNLVMQFSEGIEPFKAEGFKHKIATGQVIFSPITRIEPGQEVTVRVTAQALQAGTHIFRAQLTCSDSDSREIAEGTTRFFGDTIETKAQEINLPSKANTADATGEFQPRSTKDFK